ncbi:ABC transporter permease [Geobacillus proteiniphilus]|uniref:ABC transporter permease n=1 Tax=Geobacillus proteiniphilus TaxID=860353 RepID=A0ABY9MI53_9BACL|nr:MULTISPECIES: ABC transporter permease [Geobacillus]OPX02014.1 ABC transporter permease [Geobacillus sp. LEMMY01]WJQ13335.1 ABC transporter permease [Geobacillus stearothermophilus]WMJ17703.1 ABC transporter permease [Geobacillus proteiniphilus]
MFVSQVVAASFLKKRAEYRRYWFDFTVGLVIKFIFFLGTLYASPVQTGKEAAVRLFGFSLWYLSAHLISKLGNTAIEEAYLGTAEQVLSTRTPPWQLLIGVIVSEMLLSLVWIVLFFICAAAMLGFSEIWKGATAIIGYIAVFCGISLLGMIGIGVLILGLSFRLKQVGAVTEVLLYYLLMFSGFFLSPKLLPAVFHALNFFSPLSWAVQGMRTGWPMLAPALFVSCFWVGVGAAVLRSQWNWARKAGKLGSYV